MKDSQESSMSSMMSRVLCCDRWSFCELGTLYCAQCFVKSGIIAFVDDQSTRSKSICIVLRHRFLDNRLRQKRHVRK